MHMDPVLLERTSINGDIQAGIFAQSSRIIEAFSQYGYLFSILLLPIFSKMIKQKDTINQLTQLSFLLIIVPAIILAISCSLYRKEIIDILYKENVESSAQVFGLLIFAIKRIKSQKYCVVSIIIITSAICDLLVIS